MKHFITITILLGLAAVCAAKMKCGGGVKSTCPLMSVPCPKNPVCPKGSTVKRDGNACCCEKKPTKCGKNEFWGPCGRNSCEGCALLFRNIACKPFCQPGCQCLEGHRRDKSGQCIPVKDCKPDCPAKEVYSACSAHCGKTCKNPVSVPCTRNCVKGCVCENGLVRENGQCIKPSQCPAVTTATTTTTKAVTPSGEICPANEAYSPCTAHCGATCAEPNGVVRCTRICRKGCVCAKGLVRYNGKCIPVSQCPKTTAKPQVCAANEVYSNCGTSCQPSCKNPNPICTLQCVQGCMCAAGYVRSDEGKCILAKQCSAACGVNESWSTCAHNCKNCRFLLSGLMCRPICKEGCHCNSGYYRSNDGKCVTEGQCRSATTTTTAAVTPSAQICPANEAFSQCGVRCAATCAEPNGVVRCPRICARGCICANGLVRYNGKCIPVSQCPKTTAKPQVCAANEIYRDCGTRCQPSCSNPNPICTKECVKGCMCASGYIRSSAGKCILASQCSAPTTAATKPPTQVCPAKEVYSSCSAHCGKTCKYRDSVPCTRNCVSGCVCESGLVRENGKCIPVSQCPAVTPSAQICPANEAYTDCGARCQKTCSSPNPMICPAICAPGCLCKDGLVRAADGSCVPVAKCPSSVTSTTTVAPQSCPANEKWSTCDWGCNDCNTLNPRLACSPPRNCSARCVCIDGYRRDSSRKCIKEELCCPANEEFSRCGRSCDTSCAQPDRSKLVCNKSCFKGCVCKAGFVREGARCIKSSLCAPL